jgi:competence CoiA-like predicted nuclease
MSSNVKHQYAFDSEREQFVDIEELEKKDSRRKFICLDCGIVLTPIMGEVRQRHFRHKVDIDSVCSGESQLHLSTKIAFHKLYSDAVEKELEFRIEYDVRKVCNRYEDDNL